MTVRDLCAPVLIADADASFRTLVARWLERLSMQAVAVTTGADAMRAVRRSRPALVLLDVHLPDVSGFELCRELRDEFGENLPIILVSGEKTDDHDRIAGLLLGADEYLVKPVDSTLFIAQVRRLVRRALATEDSVDDAAAQGRFTAREREILGLLADGNDRAEIARRLVISPRTVGSHVQHLLSKLGVHSQAQAVAMAYRDGLIERPAAGDAARSSLPPGSASAAGSA